MEQHNTGRVPCCRHRTHVTTYGFLNFFQNFSKTHLLLNNSFQLLHRHPLLLHCVPVPYGYAIIFEALMVNCYTEWCANCILTTIPLSDAVFFIVLTVKIIFKIVHNLTSHLRKTILLNQWKNSNLYRSQKCRKLQRSCLVRCSTIIYRRLNRHGPLR